MKVTYISKEQWGKIFKAAVYVGASAVISYLISLSADGQVPWGTLTPIVNTVLVALKQLFTEPQA